MALALNQAASLSATGSALTEVQIFARARKCTRYIGGLDRTIKKQCRMRLQRHKANRKTLAFFRMLYEMRAPFRVLLDGNFLAEAGRLKLEWRRLLPKLLDAPAELVHLHVTECVLAELEALGAQVADVLAEARALPVLKCRSKHGHGASGSPFACASALVGAENTGKWLVASQDAALRSALRKVAGVPILLISSNVLILEPPSAASRAKVAGAEAPKSALQPEEAAAVKAAIRALKNSAMASGSGSASASAAGASSSTAGWGPAGHATAAAGLLMAREASRKRITGSSGGGGGESGRVKKKKRRGPSEPNSLSQRKKSGGSSSTSTSDTLAQHKESRIGPKAAAGSGGNRRK